MMNAFRSNRCLKDNQRLGRMSGSVPEVYIDIREGIVVKRALRQSHLLAGGVTGSLTSKIYN